MPHPGVHDDDVIVVTPSCPCSLTEAVAAAAAVAALLQPKHLRWAAAHQRPVDQPGNLVDL